jgi:hypothetical protein
MCYWYSILWPVLYRKAFQCSQIVRNGLRSELSAPRVKFRPRSCIGKSLLLCALSSDGQKGKAQHLHDGADLSNSHLGQGGVSTALSS